MSGSTTTGRKRDWIDYMFWVWGGLTFAFLFLPIVMVTIYSFNAGRILEVWQGAGLDGFHRALTDPTIKRAVETSLKASALSAILATVIGSLAGIALARRRGRWTLTFLAIVGVLLVTPEIVDAIALILWFVRLSGPLDNGLVRLVVGDSLFSIGVVTLIVRARVSGQDETLEEAAADLYATPWNRFRQITLPLVMPAVIAGLLLAFSLALDNVIISSFVALPGYTPWSAYVLSAVRAILRPEIAAMATVLLGLTLCALGLVALVLRRTGDSSADIARTMAGAG